MSGRVETEIAARYRLDTLLARGGMAEVWEGYDRLLDRAVAVKLPLPHLRQQPEFVERFRREAVAAAKLSSPRIVAVYDTGVDPEVGAYIVMELVRGPSLRRVLQNEGPLDVTRAAGVASQVAAALQFAHGRGIVHRDIKPANILMADDTVKVADFGIAKAVVDADDLTQTNVTLGTARYLSPEQLDGRAVDARSDIYSLGVVLYEMVCGRPPFEADNDMAAAVKRLTTDPNPPSAVNPDVPAWFDDAVMTALARDPAARFASASELRVALDAPARQGLAAVGGPVLAGPGGRGSGALPGGPGLGVEAPTISGFAPDMPTPAFGVPAVTTPWRERGARPVPLAVGAALVSAAILVAVIFAVLDHGSSSPNPAAPPAATTGGSSSGLAAVAVAGAHSFNPPPGDGTQDDPDLGNLTDGNAGTYWHTEWYTNPNFGNLKSGVGAYIQLIRSSPVGHLVIQSPDTGWTYQVYETDGSSAPSTLSGWGSPVGGGTVNGPVTTVTLPGRQASYILLWITNLGPSYSSGVRIGELRPST